MTARAGVNLPADTAALCDEVCVLMGQVGGRPAPRTVAIREALEEYKKLLLAKLAAQPEGNTP